MGNIAQYQAWLANFAGAEATDECGAVTWSFGTGTFSDECGATGFVSIDFTATDDCGNTSITTADFIIEDTEEPGIEIPAADEVVECDGAGNTAALTAWLTANGNAMSSDDCGGVSWSYVLGPVTAGCGLGTTQEVTFTATDDCSNTNVTTANFITQDVTPPSIDILASDETVECDGAGNIAEYQTWLTANGNAIATDACGAMTWTYVEGSFVSNCGLAGSTSVTFTVTDACDNSSVTTANFIIQDTTSPLIDVPAVDRTVECDGTGNLAEYNTWVSNNANASASEDCGTISWSNDAGPISEDCGESGSITVVFTAIDQCGNTDQTTANFIIEDTSEPDFSNVPADVDVECDNLPSVDLPDVSDNCDNALSVLHTDNTIPGTCPGEYTIERTFLAIDACGNSNSVLQRINVSDNTAPILANVPLDMTFECSSVPELGNPVSVTDNCDPNVVVTLMEETIPGTCPHSFTRIRTWTAIDACGNEVSASQNIFVQDVTNPSIINAPSDVVIDCGQLPPDPITILAIDNCDANVDIVFLEVNTLPGFDCTDSYEITRTWTATDDCGNSSVAVQTITVGGDPVPPILANVPIDVTFECSALPPLTDPVHATDNCDLNVDIVYEEVTVPSSCENTFTIERSWTAIDDCGNSTVAMQTIIVEDTTPPLMSNIPTDETISCGELPGPAAIVLATDNCDANVDVDFNETSTLATVSCMDSYTITRVWVATDNCGNSSRSEQVITVVGDDQSPVLAGVPVDITFECSALPPLTDPVHATDNCDLNVDIVYEEVTVPSSCENTFTIERSWTAIDDCGNSTVAMQTIIVEDTTPPLMSNIPTDETISCGELPGPAAIVLATDNCDANVDVDFNETSTLATVSCMDSYTITRVWVATDNCGNSSRSEQVITVVGDDQAPVLAGVPVDLTFECNAVSELGNPVTVTDNCDTNVIIDLTEEVIPGNCPQSFTRIRTWTATDACGNEVSASQNIFVQDVTEPTIINAPADLIVDCGQLPPAPAAVSVFDNCDGDVDLVFEEVNTLPGFDCTDSYEITRTWTATDDCGNSSVVTQTITVGGDGELPILSGVPADITVSCEENISNIGSVTASDNCDPNISVDFFENQLGGDCPYTYQLVRTWSAIDPCGNIVEQSQTITIEDNVAPIITGVPADVIESCSGDFDSTIPDVIATDNCDPNVFIQFAENTIPGSCPGSFETIRTWSATDACGNETISTQRILVGDNEGPVFMNVPDDLTIDCGALPELPAPNVIDNCDSDIRFEFNEKRIDGSCPNEFIIQRSWRAEDACGNISIATQEVLVRDVTAPVIISTPADITVDIALGEEIPTPVEILSFDVCDVMPTVEVSETSTSGCNYEITRVYSVSDACDNTSNVTQLITVMNGFEVDIITERTNICTDEFISLEVSPIDTSFSIVWTSDGGEILNPESNVVTYSADNAGSYSLTVFVNDGICESTASIEIEVGEIEEVNLLTNMPSCDGDTLILEVVGGATYIWDGPSGFSDINSQILIPDFNELQNGKYSVTVTTASGCEIVLDTNVDVTNELEINTSYNGPLCEGSTLELFADGGSQYAWTGPNGFVSTDQNPVINNIELATGMHFYEVTVRTFAGCEGTELIGVEILEGEDVSVVEDIIICAGDSIELGVNRGFNFVWSGPNNYASNEQFPIILNATPEMSGDYVVIVNTNTSCTLQKQISVLVEDCGCNIQAEISLLEDETCNEANGVAVLTPSTYEYIWPDLTNASAREDLENGVYEVTISDGTTCEDVITITIGQTIDCGQDNCEEPVIMDVVTISTMCEENDGSINITLENNASQYTFIWSDHNGNFGANQNELQDLSAGFYTVTITNVLDSSCSIIEEFVVDNIDTVEFENIDISPANCGLNDGSVVISPSNLSYLWVEDGVVTENRDSLGAGEYNIIVSDPSGPNCSTYMTIVVPHVGGIDSEVQIVSESICGDATGEVFISALDVLASQIVWSDGFVGDSRTNLTAGIYEVYLTNTEGCLDTINFVLGNIVDEVAITIDSIQNVTCHGNNNGGVEFTTNPLLTVDGEHTVYIEDIDGNRYTNGELEQGSYCALIRDNEDCIAGMACFEIAAPTQLEVVLEVIDCTGDMGSINLETSGGTAPYTILWSDLTSVDEHEFFRNDLSGALYNATITDALGCNLEINGIELSNCVSLEECINGFDLFTEESLTITSTDCGSLTNYCLDIPFSSLDSFLYLDNNVEFDRTIGCNYDSTFVYTYFSIPDLGLFGPYTVDGWMVNDELFSGEFETLVELIDLLNEWDPVGNWTLDEENLSISGGISMNSYANLIISQVSSGQFGILALNSNYVPLAVALELLPGEHMITVVNNFTGCADSINIFVECIDAEITPDTIDVFLELGMDTTICVDVSELSSELVSIMNYCEDISTEVVNYDINEDCINITAEFLGDDIGCFVYCDENEVCDTLVIFSVVVTEGGTAPPIAMDDDTITLINWQVFNFDITVNDTFDINTDSLIIVSSPNYGTVVLNDDLTIDYIPDLDFCGEVDSFTYIIVGQFGTATATVYLDILCEDLTIFNGFSPNGDYINDSFVITGIESFANNTLIIFNRWGNQVFYKEGYSNDNGWDGTWKGSPLPDGTYFYLLDTGEGREFSGYVQINR